MKNFIAILVAVIIISPISGCVTVNFAGGGRGGEMGRGEMKTFDFNVGDFSKIDIRLDKDSNRTGGVGIYYTAEKSDKVTIEIQENLGEFLQVYVENGTLIIESNKSFNISGNRHSPNIYIATPILEAISVSGGASIVEADKITADEFALNVEGALAGELELETKKFTCNVAGASSIVLSGTADTAHFETNGASSIEAFGLQTKDTTALLAGVGDIEISCSNTLNATVAGMGSIKYRGNPQISKSIGGMGTVTKED